MLPIILSDAPLFVPLADRNLFSRYYATQPGAIRRIVMNLFANALKYTTHGSITVSLRLLEPQALPRHSVKFADERPTHVKVIVKDTGQGMSPDYLRTKIFTAFAQENARGDGTGLGLSIVKSIIDLLRGEIDVRSIVNVGTIVTVTLRMYSLETNLATEADSSYSHEEDSLSTSNFCSRQSCRWCREGRCSLHTPEPIAPA